MFKNLIMFIKKHTINIVLIFILGCTSSIIYNLIDVTRKPPEVVVKDGSIQNHLVWSSTGSCFFVRPMTSETVYLIPVRDCDKK